MRAALVALALIASPVAAQTAAPKAEGERQLADPGREAEARALMRELRCLVCQSEPISDSQADMAVEMRALVRERMAAGESPDEVKRYLVSRYGDWVSFRPPTEGATLALWAAPVLFLGLGALAARRLFGRRRA